jgi:hypothetical protein
MRKSLQQASAPEQIAEMVFRAIAEDKFYILSHQWIKAVAKTRMEDILLGRNPTNPAG